jgi:hypothetical protein
LRHRRASSVRERCIDQLLTAFAAAGIPIILLKGAALAHRIYSSPALRPMVDVDVLVNARDTERAVAIAVGLGYIFSRRHQSRFAGRIHHLPQALTVQSGFRITLEIHRDTMSPDHGDNLTLTTLTAAPQPFRRGPGPDGMALGHTDMLRHLSRHAFEPARQVRLIALYDLWRYQAIFHDEIDWRVLLNRFPHVIVALQLASLAFVPPGDDQAYRDRPIPAGVGLGMVPLSEIAAADVGVGRKLAMLFNPPEWWLRGFYGVAPGRPLLVCRTIRQPATLARWLTRRLLAGLGSFAPSSMRDDCWHATPRFRS